MSRRALLILAGGAQPRPGFMRSSCFWTIGMGLVLAITAGSAAEPEKQKKSGPPVPTIRTNNVAPLPATEKIKISHAPYEDGDCSVCHESKDRNKPGKLTGPVNELCISCHEDFKKVLARKSHHKAAEASCVSCHNPHNSKQSKLLVEAAPALCLSCHEDIKTMSVQAKVKHDAVLQNGSCLNCHNAHGANVEHLLTKLPYDLCVQCHSTDDLKDPEGKKLTNFKKLLAENPQMHGPVSSKDCSACHKAHGSDNFRLLIEEYPALFYSPYEPKLYALCFECHEDSILAQPETTTLTQFRNGKVNLHYLHVNKSERGRTCRACHEVHASKQKHQIRESVPYGSKGWLLKVGYTQTPTGGYCAKTCHETRGYTNKVASATSPAPVASTPSASSGTNSTTATSPEK